jgi:hypothetical protein
MRQSLHNVSGMDKPSHQGGHQEVRTLTAGTAERTSPSGSAATPGWEQGEHPAAMLPPLTLNLRLDRHRPHTMHQQACRQYELSWCEQEACVQRSTVQACPYTDAVLLTCV